jgi:hypothetical protein
MIDLLIALAISGQAAPAPAVTGRALRDIPGITITYHDLAEKDVKAISKSLSKKKALNAQQNALLSASTNWSVSPSVTRATKDGVCSVTKAQTDFKASADLPRFNEAAVPPADLGAWRDYLAKTEAQAAAKLWFVKDRLPTFDQAVIGKSCDQAMKDGAAAIAQLKADAAAFRPQVEPAASAAPAPAAPAR